MHFDRSVYKTAVSSIALAMEILQSCTEPLIYLINLPQITMVTSNTQENYGKNSTGCLSKPEG